MKAAVNQRYTGNPGRTHKFSLDLPVLTRYNSLRHRSFPPREDKGNSSTGLLRPSALCGKVTTMGADSREVMNIRQASQYLGVSPDTLYKYVTEEKIPAFKLGNRWKFKKTILDQRLEQKSTMNMGSAKKKPRPAKAVAGR